MPDLIGISIYSSNVKIRVNWAQILRAKIPNTVIFGGGPHIPLAGRKFMEAYAGCFDVVFQGDGEEPTLALLSVMLKVLPAQKPLIDYLATRPARVSKSIDGQCDYHKWFDFARFSSRILVSFLI